MIPEAAQITTTQPLTQEVPVALLTTQAQWTPDPARAAQKRLALIDDDKRMGRNSERAFGIIPDDAFSREAWAQGAAWRSAVTDP